MAVQLGVLLYRLEKVTVTVELVAMVEVVPVTIFAPDNAVPLALNTDVPDVPAGPVGPVAPTGPVAPVAPVGPSAPAPVREMSINAG